MSEPVINFSVFNTSCLIESAMFSKAYSMVSLERKKKVDKYKRPEDKRASVGAEILLARGISKMLGKNIAPHELKYRYGDKGKPYLLDYPDIFFNVSHSKQYVVCAISDHEVGCDIQCVREFDPEMVKRFFAKKEQEQVLFLNSIEEKKQMFFRLWALKESFIKATGKGLYQPLDEFCISLDKQEPYLFKNPEISSYMFKELFVAEGFTCSVCVKAD